MDHVYNSIASFYEVYLDDFLEGWRTGEYKKFSECPSYYEVKAIIDAMNILRKYLEWETIKLSEEVKLFTDGN